MELINSNNIKQHAREIAKVWKNQWHNCPPERQEVVK